jgi:NAD(P)-dependent dehydrogenase (short-subunit alcohol dehydrogenase family)
MRGLRNRVAVITGAANGIGAATARRLHEEGAKVALLDVDAANGSALAERLGDGRALFIGCDVVSEEQVEAAVNTTVERFGGVDVLVNNAGVNAYFDAEKMTLDEWERFFTLDLRACWLCSKHVLPHLRR